MSETSFTISFTVVQTPEEVFAAINNVRGWWSGDIEGETGALGGEFTYRYQDVHRSTQQIVEFVPASRVVWRVSDAYLDLTADKTEWTGTDITFEISAKEGATEVRFSHVGLNPAFECFDMCSSAWGFYINGSLRNLITAGQGAADE